MSIRTIRTAPVDGMTLITVEITDDDDKRVVYEVACPNCDDLIMGLTKDEARNEIDEHECTTPERETA